MATGVTREASQLTAGAERHVVRRGIAAVGLVSIARRRLRKAKKAHDEALLRRRVVPAVLAGVLGLAGAVIAGQQSATAAGGPIIAGLAPSSTTTTVGTPVTLVGSATNTTNATQRVSMGVGFPTTVSYAGALGGNGCHPRHTVNLVYCGLNLPAGATATITLTVVPKMAGTSTLHSYARITYTNDDTLAYATITAS